MFAITCSILTREKCKNNATNAFQTTVCIVKTMILRKLFITVSGNKCDLYKLITIPSNLENSIAEFLF